MIKHYKISFLLSLLIGVSLITRLSAQEAHSIDSRVDSVFNSYFHFLTRDTSEFDTIAYDNEMEEMEKGILISVFFENISGHFLQRRLYREHDFPKKGKSWYCYSTNNGFSKICVIYTNEEFTFWKLWYAKNKFLLTWIGDDKKISINPTLDFSYYEQNYPFKIRFKDKEDWVPISTKPKHVLELEKQMDNADLSNRKSNKPKKQQN